MSQPSTSGSGAAGPRPYKRQIRNLLIHKPMQREFTFVVIALLMVSTAVVGFVIHDTLHQASMGGGFQFGRINPYEVLAEVEYQLLLKITAILFITLIIMGAFGIFFLHRIAGPVYRFRRILRKLSEGEISPPVRIREGDFFGEVVDDLNNLLDRLRNQQR